MARVLLDENLPHALRESLGNHETETAAHAGLAGYKNGELIRTAMDAGFDVLLTGDKTLQHEQNLAGQKIALVCLSANAWRIIKPHAAKIAAAVDAAAPGSVTLVDIGKFARQRNRPEGPTPG
jgi:hypothetical protein